MPSGAGRLLLAVGAGTFATWSIGGAYQAFAPTITAQRLGNDDPLVAAAMFSSIMFTGPLGTPIAARLPHRTAARAVITVFALAIIGALISLAAGAIIPFLLASLIAKRRQTREDRRETRERSDRAPSLSEEPAAQLLVRSSAARMMPHASRQNDERPSRARTQPAGASADRWERQALQIMRIRELATSDT